jgi:hypothetical protein
MGIKVSAQVGNSPHGGPPSLPWLLFVAANRVEEVLATAHRIWQTERPQTDQIKAGDTLREQTVFDDYPPRRQPVLQLEAKIYPLPSSSRINSIAA